MNSAYSSGKKRTFEVQLSLALELQTTTATATSTTTRIFKPEPETRIKILMLLLAVSHIPLRKTSEEDPYKRCDGPPKETTPTTEESNEL